MRYKEFNSNNVLEKCMVLFWQNGFESCSINQIVESTGVNRFSLYKEFKNKEGLLVASLELYYDRYFQEKLKALDLNQPVELSLKNFYTQFLTESDQHPAGCYIISISNEVADVNKAVNSILDKLIKELGIQIQSIFKDKDERQADIAFFARHLVGLFCTTMSFCLIHDYEERIRIVDVGIQTILEKNKNYASKT